MDDFIRAYFDCAINSLTDDNGDPLTQEPGLSLFAAFKLIHDCRAFQEANAALLQQAYDADPTYSEAHAGSDFWLTRNGHGTGFWDRGLGSVGDLLTSAAEAYGTQDLYVGDNGLIYV